MTNPTTTNSLPDVNPATRYARPADIVVDATLSPDEKRSLLAEWEEDVRARLVASEEGMTGATPAVSLADVLAARDALPESAEPRTDAPTKS